MTKIYTISKTAKLLITILAIFLLMSGGLVFFSRGSSVFEKIITLSGLIFFGIGIPAIYGFKIFIDNNGIQIRNFDVIGLVTNRRSKDLALNWNEIGELETRYVLYPESPIIVLKPKLGMFKKKIEFMMFGMPIELLVDILSHLLQGTKVSLYTNLKRKLEGKQTVFFMKQEWHETDTNHIKIKPHIYTKRQLIIIGVFLIVLVITGFLLSWFLCK